MYSIRHLKERLTTPRTEPRYRKPRERSLRSPFGLRAHKTDATREIIAGFLGWMTVVTSLSFCE